MAVRRVFVVSSAGLTAWHRRGAKLLDPFSFAADEVGLGQFERYLEQLPDAIACVLADVVEEEFREETIPHVLAWDRRTLLRTKAARAFPGARYVHAMRLGREPDGRRDDHVLISAITRPETLAPWLAPMARHGVPLAGICSPAALTGTMLKAIGARGEAVVVVSLHPGGGLRQTCFRDGRLQLSRLATLPDLAVHRYGSHVLAEVERTRRYLGSLRTLAGDDALDVYVLSHGERLETLRRELRSNAGHGHRAGCIPVDLAEVARKLGLRRWGGEPTAERLFVHLLARRPPPNHYATPDQTRDVAMRRARFALKAASAGVVATACLFSAVVALDGVAANGHARSFALQAALYEARYRAARTTLPPAPAEPAELEQVVSAASTLHRRRPDPVDVLALISDALAGFSDVRIESLSWRVSDDVDAPAGAGNDGPGSVPAPTTPLPSGEEPGSDPKALFQVVRVSARIEPFDGDYRAAIETVRHFVEALAVPPGVVHVRVLSLPLELDSGHTLTGTTETTAEAAVFQVQVSLRVGATDADGAET